MKTRLIGLLTVLLMFNSSGAIVFFTDKPNAVPVDSDFFALQRNRDYINTSVAQLRGMLFGNPAFTGNGSIGGSFVVNGVLYGNGGGLTNIGGLNFLPITSGNGTNESFWGVTFFQEVDALNFYPTNLFTGKTNVDVLGTDGNGQLSLAFVSPTNIDFTAGQNITFTTNGHNVTIAGSSTNVINTVTNNTFVNTNVFISTSNAYFNIVIETNVTTITETNNTFVNTNVMILQSNATFTIKKGATLVIETNAFLVDSNITASSAVITTARQDLTNAVNAHGVFTNSATGPPSFGLLQPTEMANTGTAGTYTKTTFNAQGLETSGSSAVLASADFANQGTTTTLLHGNASGNPSFGQVVAADIQAGISPTLNAANVTNVSGGVVTGGTAFLILDASYLWPGDTIPATWTTNTPGAGSSSVQSAGPTFKAWSVSQTASNRWLAQINLVDWDGGAINVSMNVVSGTNSLVANAQTNVWAVQAARVGTALGTAVAVTNKLSTGTSLITTNFDCNTVTVAGSPNVSDSCLIQIESRAGNTPWSSTNVEYLTAVFIRYSKTNIQNNAISWP